VASQATRDHCLAPTRVLDADVAGGRYQRMIAELPALSADEPRLHALGSRGGPCDGAALEHDGGDDARGAAGWPFFGQFVAHDITADRSPLEQAVDPEQLRNFRTPRANLESVYGGGPVGSPYLYDVDDGAKLLLGEGGHDVPRNQQGIALIGDPRNDSHLFVNQLHVAFLRAHNLLAEQAGEFETARRQLIWHYQWILLHDYLPKLVGEELAAELLEGDPVLYRADGAPYIPFEFADAAFRYGHSQIRHRYQVNDRFGPCPMFPDLIGFGAVSPERAVDWSLLFDVPGRPPAQRAKRIDGHLPGSLIQLPAAITGHVDDAAYHSLAARDLQRGQATGLPSGEAVARQLGERVLKAEEVGLRPHGWESETPLWYYVLREADVLGDGDRLGPVGGRIVGEVLVGIVDADPGSFRALDRSWTPVLPAAEPGRFTLTDFLRAA
jgi:Animal haem peroxidase